MFRRLFLLLFLLFFLTQGCATVDKKHVQVIPGQPPAISQVLKQNPAERVLKRKVAIARFSNETKYGQGFFHDENQDRVGKQAMDILSSKLASTGKFILLERADLEKINKELAMGDLSQLNVTADYLVLGSVSEFGRKTTGEVGVFSRTKKQVAHAKVNIRLVDVHSGQIIYSEEGEGDSFSEAGTVMGIGGRAGYDSSLNDRALSAAISKLVNNVIENLLDKPWRGYILSYDNGAYIISGGKTQGIKRGDVFTVFRRGKRMKNPQTNMMIELPGTLLGRLTVNQLAGNDPNNEVSICSKTSGSVPVGDFANLYIQERD